MALKDMKPIEYVQSLRLEEARQWLKIGGVPMEAAAYESD